jgi:G3E family GTPase
MSTPFFLVTGFLGSGKTTLLKNFINSYAETKKIAVIQNEFAHGNVDGRDLKRTGKFFKILEINNGSVFCVCLLADFIKSLSDLLDSDSFDAIFLEATGLADPIAVGQLLHAPSLKNRLFLAHVWCVVDASNFIQIEKTVTRISHQVRIADTVIINKVDKTSTEIEQIQNRIKEINPFALIVSTTFCELELFDIFEKIPSPIALKQIDKNEPQESEGRPDIGSAVVRTTNPISLENLNYFLGQEGLDTYRLKGFVNLDNGSKVVVQSCFGDTQIEEVPDYMGPTEIIAMGPKIDADRFMQRFNALI